MKLDRIFEDKRGEIYALTGTPLTVPEVSFMSCGAGQSRGGCEHDINSEHLVVISGTIIYVYDEDQKHIMLKPGQSFTISPKTPHYFIALTDCVVMEWGATIDEKQNKHKKFRKIVMEINNQ